jgi:hypothetical protein
MTAAMLVAVIALRLALFLGVFFALRWLAARLELPRGMPLALALLGISTLIAFGGAAVVLGQGLRSALIAGAVIYGVIAALWLMRRPDLNAGDRRWR